MRRNPVLIKLIQWEHWPTLAFYVPLLPFFFWRSVKAGHPIYYTITNPGILFSGNGTESKFKSLHLLPESVIPRSLLIPKGDDLKSIEDSFASAANYINKIGWKKNEPCFIRVKLTSDIPKKLLNTSAKKLHNKDKFQNLKKYIIGQQDFNIDDRLIAAIITPDKDIIPDSENLEPAFIVFENYEKILQWNRSLRFGLAVCTLKNKLENEL